MPRLVAILGGVLIAAGTGVAIPLLTTGGSEGDSGAPAPPGSPAEHDTCPGVGRCEELQPAQLEAPDPGGDEAARIPVPPPGKYFGFNWTYQPDFTWGPLTMRREAQLASAAGANVLKMTFQWQVLEPRRDQWARRELHARDRFVRELARHGIRPLIVLMQAPDWAVGGSACPESCPPARRYLGEWQEFAARIARRYPKAAGIEVWNEPNLATYWQPTPDPAYYARLQAHAYRAIKRVAPHMQVGTGGLAGNLSWGSDGSWPIKSYLSAAYRHGLRSYIDFLAIHPYPYDTDLGPGTIYAQVFHDVRATAARFGDADIPLWATELGYSTTGSTGHSVDPSAQAQHLTRIYRKTATMPDVEAVIVHTLFDRPAFPVGSVEQGWGLIARAPTLTPKPAYCAFVEGANNVHPWC